MGQVAWSRSFSFAFVRNPWDLMVSSYRWWLEKADRWDELRPAADEIRGMGSFPTFIHSPYGRQMINEQSGTLRDWICDGDGQIIVDRVGRFERLRDDWAEISETIGVNVPLPHLNQGTRGPYQDYYDDASRGLIEERFDWAIEHFKYRF